MIVIGDGGQQYASSPGDLAGVDRISSARYAAGVHLLDEHSELTNDNRCVRCKTVMPCPPRRDGEWLTELYAEHHDRVQPAFLQAPHNAHLAGDGADFSPQE
ncbi:hypothetical protein [Actinoplanes sp. URMC 104]|uniref:hypothetical protein n=1 Tax=Actinoplanes sp. URMC 104 TaxID=3423409 RepID=UPI003F194B96